MMMMMHELGGVSWYIQKKKGQSAAAPPVLLRQTARPPASPGNSMWYPRPPSPIEYSREGAYVYAHAQERETETGS